MAIFSSPVIELMGRPIHVYLGAGATAIDIIKTVRVNRSTSIRLNHEQNDNNFL